MKDQAFMEQLQQELPRRNLSERATQRFEDTYRMLGVQQEAPVRKHHHKGLWVTATTVCLCCGLMFGVNAAFPAFAESLPGVGRFFEAVNGSFATNSGKDLPVGTYLETYPVVEDVNTTTTSGEYTLEVQQAFCDGELLTFSLDLSMPAQDAEPYSWIVTPYAGTQKENPNRAVVTINGTDYTPDGESALFAQGDGHFVGSMAFHLNDPVESGQDVSVSISFPELDGRLAVNQGENGEIEFLPLSTNLTTSFTVPVNTEENFAFSCSAEDNGFQVTNVEASPMKTAVSVSMPQLGYIDGQGSEGIPVLYTSNGDELSFASTESMEQGYDPFSGNSQDATLLFDGAPQGTNQLVLRFYQDYSEEKVLAEFSIDLANKTVTPSTTYQDGGMLDINGPFHYDVISGGPTEGIKFTNGLGVAGINYIRWDDLLNCTIQTQGDYRDIHVTLTNTAGEKVASGDSQNVEYSLATNTYFSPADENTPTAFYRIQLVGEQGSYLPARGETLTVSVTDTATGQELIRQDVVMDESHTQ
ncbi:MAG: DUF4179 domain-containing protein [Acutalibacter sp.]